MNTSELMGTLATPLSGAKSRNKRSTTSSNSLTQLQSSACASNSHTSSTGVAPTDREAASDERLLVGIPSAAPTYNPNTLNQSQVL